MGYHDRVSLSVLDFCKNRDLIRPAALRATCTFKHEITFEEPLVFCKLEAHGHERRAFGKYKWLFVF